jgi:hypothetical protein
MGAEEGRIETDAGEPLRHQPGVLAGREATIFAAAAMEQKIAGTFPGRRKLLVDRLARLLGDLEPDRKTGLCFAARLRGRAHSHVERRPRP